MPTYTELRALPEVLRKEWTVEVCYAEVARTANTVDPWYFHPAFVEAKLKDMDEELRAIYVYKLRVRIEEME